MPLQPLVFTPSLRYSCIKGGEGVRAGGAELGHPTKPSPSLPSGGFAQQGPGLTPRPTGPLHVPQQHPHTLSRNCSRCLMRFAAASVSSSAAFLGRSRDRCAACARLNSERPTMCAYVTKTPGAWTPASKVAPSRSRGDGSRTCQRSAPVAGTLPARSRPQQQLG